MDGRKRVRADEQDPIQHTQKMLLLLQKIKQSQIGNTEHPLEPLMKGVQTQKHPILPTLKYTSDVYKINNDRKKKPIQYYLDAVNTIYKKKDLDVLINPLTYSNVFESWAPKEIAIFEQAILKFGKRFEYISELIQTKNVKQVYEFYLEWKTTSHFKSYRTAMNAANRSNLSQWI